MVHAIRTAGAGKPLDSYETVLKYIRTTKTKTGLRAQAPLEREPYATGERITDSEMAELCLTRQVGFSLLFALLSQLHRLF